MKDVTLGSRSHGDEEGVATPTPDSTETRCVTGYPVGPIPSHSGVVDWLDREVSMEEITGKKPRDPFAVWYPWNPTNPPRSR